ncbi:hypothetical protein FDI29_gp32 [Arthrobacter phage Abidatro]|uniref:Uncharacterized protein n=1 Tax=Arthrobacter phage Abidatro TaxID=2015853 RepID=A0A222ZFZ0_9CAUD|nr:hypothetical protein FDI29_gp32 [Arthrobacter phage Abidatro]ASR83202.1 hypothetical protein SEA_ABIDATRO_32 [Arthrobacter phage Abidatro]
MDSGPFFMRADTSPQPSKFPRRILPKSTQYTPNRAKLRESAREKGPHQMITVSALAKELANQHGISQARAKLILSIAAAELDIADAKSYSLRTAGELEAIVARKISK